MDEKVYELHHRYGYIWFIRMEIQFEFDYEDAFDRGFGGTPSSMKRS